MPAVFLAVSHFQSGLRDSCVMMSTDNTSVVTYIQAQGGNTFSLPVSESQGITCSLQDAQYFSSGQIYSRSPQRPGGLVVSQTPVTTIRVDTSSRSDQSDLSHFWLSSGRPICDQTQPKASTVCESSVRSSSVGSRCAFVDWDQLDAYAYPPPILITQILASG
ncbi:hypothetical protein DPMN_001625 [Dreissena polymorpha]|uniref:Uncharacterized protein n=1 Tax=Dreissena polymorpha TaxID=45954 RepID=A0A9D4MHL7_DREPO|nr:hypothetical protein DPMN_001625 [Dreissena polymorpha]